MRTKDEFVEVDDCTFRIRCLFSEEKTALVQLVFLHDALGSIEQWKGFPKCLVEQCKLDAIIIERQGHGQSSPFLQNRNKNYLHQEAWKVLPRILETLQVSSPILIGHSDGASIALLYASKFQPSTVVSIAAHVFVEAVTLESIANTLTKRSALKAKLTKYHGDKTDALLDAWSETWLSEDFRNWNIEQELSGVQAPVLVIQSKDDEYGSGQQVESIINNVSTEATRAYEPEEGGHAPHLKLKKDLVVHISSWIRSLLQ